MMRGTGGAHISVLVSLATLALPGRGATPGAELSTAVGDSRVKGKVVLDFRLGVMAKLDFRKEGWGD